MNGGLDGARHVFLGGNDLPARLCPGFHIAELGFGTGLNLLALARIATVPVRFTSFEAYPMSGDELARAHAAFPELADLSAQLRDGWPARRFTVGQVSAEVIEADARAALPAWPGRADMVSGRVFAGQEPRALQGADLMAEVAAHTAPGGTFATYTAAGHVRRALAAAGFAVTRAPGFAGKRHMSRGQL